MSLDKLEHSQIFKNKFNIARLYNIFEALKAWG